MTDVWNALVAGFAGTVVLTTALRLSNELGWTRMDIPFLLGTAFTVDRTRAKVAGYLVHFATGVGFALVYLALFEAVGRSGWLAGAIVGLFHAFFAGTALVNILLPAVHPRMGRGSSAADTAPLLESPGFMLTNYGRSTPVVTILAHLAYGGIVGWIVKVP